MLRYCENCKKDFDFAPLAVSGSEPLICPECGNVVGKNSRNPEKKINSEKTDENIGRAIGGIFHLFYIFYMVMGIIGVVSYILGAHFLLYIVTAISLTVYIIQLLTGTAAFFLGIVFIPIGAIAGFIIMNGVSGACLGIHVVFLIRHLIRDVFFSLIGLIIKKSAG